MTSKKTYRPRTRLIHEAEPRSPYGETSEALYLTSGFIYDDSEQAYARFRGDEEGYQYSRFGNPTVRGFEKRMIALEGAEDARATATGMAAVGSAFLCELTAGDHVVAAKALFGSCRYIVETLLPRFGISSSLVDGDDLSAWEKACTPKTKMFFLESPTNPLLELVDIDSVAKLAHKCGAKLIVDNVFATPLLQQPLKLGADIVVYSATKHIDGQGRCLGGIVLGKKQWVEDYLAVFIRQFGPSLSPFNAWVMLKSLETLELRVNAKCDNAEVIVDFLSQQEKVRKIFYPHHPSHKQFELAKKQMIRGGSLISFELEGGQKEAFAFANALGLFGISNNLGDTKSLITHPATTTHYRLGQEKREEIGIGENVLRLSIGLEDPQDLIDDLSQALKQLG